MFLILSRKMHSLLKILLLLVCLKLNEIDGRIHVQPIVCSEVIPSSLDYSLDIEQIDDDHKLSMEGMFDFHFKYPLHPSIL